MQKDKDGYRAKLNGLVEFCNWLAQDMPWRLREAVEGLDQDNMHPVVVSFVMLCDGMLKRFKVEFEELKTRKFDMWFFHFLYSIYAFYEV